MSITSILRALECEAGRSTMDPAVRVHLEQAIHQVEIAAEVNAAICHASFNELLDAVHHEAGIDSKHGKELGGGG